VIQSDSPLPRLGRQYLTKFRRAWDSALLTSPAYSDYNETYIYETDGHCTGYSSGACVIFRGGAYDTSKSFTGKCVSSRKNSDGFGANWKEDTIGFSSNTSRSSFGFGVPQQDLNQGFTRHSQLGLGRNSSFLRALVSAGDIGTKRTPYLRTGRWSRGEADSGVTGSRWPGQIIDRGSK
jgi:hypothetical protein